MVFVLDKTKTPLAPTTESKARILLKKGKAVVHKIFPFTIRLKENKTCTKSFEIKFDVGTTVTGVAIVDAIKCFFFAEIEHIGKAVKKAMDSRRAIRRSRRAKGSKIVKGFQTGDIVKAIVTKGKKIGTYLGKVAVRVSGNFNITTQVATIQGIHHKYCKTIQKGDGYAYSFATTKI